MKRAVNHKKAKHKRAQKRKLQRKQAAKSQNTGSQVVVKQETSSGSIPARKSTSKRKYPKAFVALDILIGMFGFISGGIVVAIKMPFWVNLFLNNFTKLLHTM